MTAQTLTTSPDPELVRYVRVTDITTTAKHKGALPISPSTLWRWIKAGSFPQPLRLSSQVVVWKESDITAWLAAREQAGAVEGGEQ
jgi:predicted DNA-binding transcriptional regulator AlpA